MRKTKEMILKLCIVVSLYSLVLGFSSTLHRNNYNEDKLKYTKKVVIVKLIKSDKNNYDKFMKIVDDSKLKLIKKQHAKIIKDEKIKQEKIAIQKAKAKQIEIAKTSSLSRGGDIEDYDTEFEVTFYTSIYGNITSSGDRARDGVVANNVLQEGSRIRLEGYGTVDVLDTGGYEFDSPNRLDIFVSRQFGESNRKYEKRVSKMGRKHIRGSIIK